ncbi:MAG: class I SAM-dependent methyltransferase [Actinomycetota bacterium]|nr:class I SAM-dependent methyltransferase [Actinomycetota bacterium]
MAQRMRAEVGGYYGSVRNDLVDLLPTPIGAVLDIGCGEAATADALRARGATRIVGVEVVEEAARLARGRLDDVRVGPVEDELDHIEGPFDTVLAWDVLEHLADPYSVVRNLCDLTTPGGHLQVSVPNARHVSLVTDLMVRGTFGYTDWGHRDRTHLRWFTRGDLLTMLAENGWEPISTSHPRLGRSALLDRLTGGRSTEFLVGQWYALARRAP